MPVKVSRNKKRLWISVGIILLLLLVGALLINSILAPVIGRKITGAASKGDYRLSYEKIRVNIFTGTVVLDSVRLQGDMVKANAKRIEVSGIKVFQYWLHKKLEIAKVHIDGTIASFRKQQNSKANSPDSSKTLYQKISGSLKLLAVSDIEISDTRLDYVDSAKKAEHLHLQGLNFEARDLLIDSATQRDSGRTLFCKEIITGIRHFSASTQNGLYHFSIAGARYSTLTKRLVATGIAFKAAEIKRFFAGMNADRFEFSLDSVAMERFDYKAYLRDTLLHASRISAYRGKLDIFGDYEGKPTPGDRVNGFPNVVLRHMSTHLIADTVDLSGITVHYSELNKDDGKIGTVEFAHTRGRFLNISNWGPQLKKDPWCVVKISSRFMDAGALEVNARFNQVNEACSYMVSGSMGPMPALAVNRVAVPLGQAKIKSGQIISLTVSINGNQFKNTGTLKLSYENLDLEILSKQLHKKPLQTVVANAIVIRKNNPDTTGGQARVSPLLYIRPKNKPFFGALWETLSPGIKSTITDKKPAVPPKHESVLKKIIDAPGKLFKKKS